MSRDPTARARRAILDAARSNYVRLGWIAVRGRLWRIEVDGDSMVPSLRSGDVVWCEARPDVRTLRVGDIVVFTGRASPGHEGTQGSADWGIKRISALHTQMDEQSGHAWRSCEVRGDNADHSADSRHFGSILLEDVLARVIVVPSSSPRRRERAGAWR